MRIKGDSKKLGVVLEEIAGVTGAWGTGLGSSHTLAACLWECRWGGEQRILRSCTSQFGELLKHNEL